MAELNNENEERQAAELEFIQAAYLPDEAWCTNISSSNDEQNVVHRRLVWQDSSNGTCCCCCWELQLIMPAGYPGDNNASSCVLLQVQGTVCTTTTSNNTTTKLAFDALPDLLRACREAAVANAGQEAVMVVLQAADDWIAALDEQGIMSFGRGGGGGTDEASSSPSSLDQTTNCPNEKPNHNDTTRNSTIVLGRRLIYSHHIIAKRKRADLQQLAGEFNLTGYVKIGWPGLIVMEGLEEDCQAFYDVIRKWSWQYLVVRGEMQEPLLVVASKQQQVLQEARRFKTWQEVDDMSIVAQHCRRVGLEALFRTSMKVYGDNNEKEENNDAITTPTTKGPSASSWYGALIHVDHMNNAKAYRKWLVRTCQEHGVLLLIQQCYPANDYSKKPVIVIGLIEQNSDSNNSAAGAAAVSTVLQQWRTRKVDVDSRGKPCLERQMTVLTQGPLVVTEQQQLAALLESVCVVGSSSNTTNNTDRLHTTPAKLKRLLKEIGGDEWVVAVMMMMMGMLTIDD